MSLLYLLFYCENIVTKTEDFLPNVILPLFLFSLISALVKQHSLQFFGNTYPFLVALYSQSFSTKNMHIVFSF